MRIKTVGLAVLVAGSMMGDGLAQQTLEDEIQQEEAPGSAIEMDIGRGGVVIERQRNLNPSPVENRRPDARRSQRSGRAGFT
jgi:hypothetical protein